MKLLSVDLLVIVVLVIVILVIAISSYLDLCQLLLLEPSRQSILQPKYHRLVRIPSITHHQHFLLILHHLNLFEDISNIVLINL